ncbi:MULTISPECIES: flagellin lysine-N-methylase [Citrobacter freundii complex]|uniref:flagellin lysine-N-methylase n=1 Tax=Citrobacter freundii complex TaxID=1344959 RepID=UPI0006502E6E|nr:MULTISPECIES: flagellin lysine-N-methylase [Citrobacter freundii complex]QNM20360.1 flagellin lysine-N-methylase [Citrobacter freundii]MEB7911223.1 flagellin lysine-N-methylase [Citrobacter portucalensis]QNM25819.1 flagellin lysine-N-methylase [Citrobacter freundii]QNM30513.1 flagellin lysine-N-methylase [Citrobacter freundii]QNM35749.1 flagellin lysine-N-methylase [Citrobacter freundii]
MQEITVTEPHFVTTFQCTGTQCRDHCCKSWNIYLDKSTVNKYLSSKDNYIKRVAKENIILLKKDVTAWGVVKLVEGSGNCPYLTEDSLCQVQNTLGAHALSATCKTFPRINRVYKNDVRKSLNLSCPEVASLVLTDPNAMALSESSIIAANSYRGSVFSQQQKLLNLLCLSLVEQSGSDVNVGLYTLIKLSLCIKKFDKIDNVALSKIEPVYQALLAQIQSGELRGELSTFSTDNKTKVTLVLLLQDYFRNLPVSRSSGVLNYYVQCLLRTLIQEEHHSVGEGVAKLEATWQKVYEQRDEAGFDLKNFILYKIWENNFPNQKNVDPLRTLYMISVEYYFIKMLIAASAFERTYLEKEDAINIVYSFHSLSQHNPTVHENFQKHIETVRTGDDLSMIHLLT